MKGKVADVVMAVRNGEQIVRKYQPIVSNPNSAAQVANRAKMKLMSQLSAVMAPVIAIPRMGTKSSRNLFVKTNYKSVTYTTDTASIPLADVQLTSSVVALPAVFATRGADSINANLGTIDVDVNRVVYAMFAKYDNELRYVGSAVANEAGTVAAPWAVTLPLVSDDVVVYAYGIRDNNENAKVVFGNLETPDAQTVANLIVTRTLLESDITVTRTRGTELAATTNNAVSPATNSDSRTSKKK